MKTKTNKNKPLLQIDGKLDVPAEDKKIPPRTLDELWGQTKLGRYHTFNEQEYTDFLNEMNKSDLQRHAITCSLIPIDNRNILTQRLLREFKKYVLNCSTTFHQPAKEKKISKEVLKILAEGK